MALGTEDCKITKNSSSPHLCVLIQYVKLTGSTAKSQSQHTHSSVSKTNDNLWGYAGLHGRTTSMVILESI